jgi:16S rRNA (guanine527-N7)-methyltransferase
LRRGGGAAAEALAPFDFLTPEARERLEAFVELLRRWQRAHNLVSRATLDAVWSRHVGDSLQLVPYAPPVGHWLDMGSGAGFPGLVVAIALAGRPLSFTLVESSAKKCAFLREAVRATGAAAEVWCMRIEELPGQLAAPPDVISARALAPFGQICELAAPLMGSHTLLLLLKGRGFGGEEAEARRAWAYELEAFPSRTDAEGRIVAVRHLRGRQ